MKYQVPGVGLAISKEICEFNGWKIRATSEKNFIMIVLTLGR